MSAADAFVAAYGVGPDGVWQAPGRVTLVGEHTDHTEGLAIAFAIDRRTSVAARRRSDGRVRLRSTAKPGAPTGAELAELAPGRAQGWSAYPLGVLWALRQGGLPVPGVDLLVDSTVPVGRGVSSSAALTLAVATAVNDLAGGGADLLQASHLAEHDFVGAPTGLLDQLTILQASEGAAVLADFRSLAVERVPLEIGPLVIIDTGVGHHNAGGEYADRRQACEAAAVLLGVETLRDVPSVDGLAALTGPLKRRARHVVTENARVREVASLLRHPPVDQGMVGAALDASHRSLRDDFEVSWPEAELAVTASKAAGAAGARMIGGGFGGCCLALGAAVSDVAAAVTDAYERAGVTVCPEVFAVTPSGGPSRVS